MLPLAIAGIQAAGQIGAAAAGGPFMGGNSESSFGSSTFDNSGWTVNVGSGSARTDNAQTKPQATDPIADRFASGLGFEVPAMQSAGINPTIALVVVAGLVAVVFLRRK